MKSEAMEAKLATTTLSTYAQEYYWIDIFKGHSGRWMDVYEAGDGYLACGMAIRNEGKLFFIGDDSANNALKLIFCHELNYSSGTGIMGNLEKVSWFLQSICVWWFRPI
jgi:hypothetical protein